MNNFGYEFYLLILSILVVFSMLIYLYKKKKRNQLHNFFIIDLLCLLVISIGVLLQTIFTTYTSIPPIVFENIIYIGTCFFPVFFLLTCIIFTNTKITIKKRHLLLFVIPILSIILLWTNDFHHLFYKYYSDNLFDNLSKTTYGNYFIVHTIYSYLCIFIGILNLINYSIKNSGFFSSQSLLICFGSFISVGINILATLGILDLSIYATPIAFTIAIFFIALAIFKFDFLKVAPIALQKIVDRMSDAYIVINDNYIVTDFNETFLNIFNLDKFSVRNKSLFDIIKGYDDLKIDLGLLKKTLDDVKDSDKTMLLEEHFSAVNKDFHIEINRITSKGNFLGILILLKDITQHNIDMQTIKDNQEMLIEKERLASLGQMIGGIAHNLKTPIMSIAGAAEGLSDLIHEYDTSIEDPEVTVKDHHDIAKDMSEWIEKIRTHLSYMSDVITAIKGQAVNFSDQTSSSFTIKELINYVNILMKHELDNALINLNIQADVDTSLSLNGNINSLVQVINNIISNAIQAYQSNGKTNENINFNIYKEKSNMIFKIEDQGGGLPEDVQDKLFREMVTTKGKNGTGLGLFMSYSNIKAHFNGNISYTTAKGEGTAFLVEIPYSE